MGRPYFGTARDEVVLEDRRVVVVREFVAPGLTMGDLAGIYESRAGAPPAPSGVAAVVAAVLDAVYGPAGVPTPI